MNEFHEVSPTLIGTSSVDDDVGVVTCKSWATSLIKLSTLNLRARLPDDDEIPPLSAGRVRFLLFTPPP